MDETIQDQIIAEAIPPRSRLDENVIAPLEDDLPTLQQTILQFLPDTDVGFATTTTNEVVGDLLANSPLNGDRKKELLIQINPELIVQDRTEHAEDWACLYRICLGKARLAALQQKLIKEEMGRQGYERITSSHDAVLATFQEQLTIFKTAYDNLIEKLGKPTANTYNNRRTLHLTKQTLAQNAMLHAAASIATEHVAQSPGHNGIMHALIKDVNDRVFDQLPSGYTRAFAGSFSQLLKLGFLRQYRVPDLSASAGYQAELYTSGIGGIASILDAVSQLESEVIIPIGTYFEVISIAEALKHALEPLSLDENFYRVLADKLVAKTNTPLTIIAQPYSSSADNSIFDLNRVLNLINNPAVKRPIMLIIDSTMHGPSLQKWTQVNQITKSGVNFTYIEAQSLVKHGQYGTDKVPGGLALAYGCHPEIINYATASRASGIPEFNAAYLFPFDSDVQLHRITRAGRNARFIANRLRAATKNNPLFEGVIHASSTDNAARKQYPTDSPILFLQIHPLAAEYFKQRLEIDFGGIHRLMPETTYGTSYGFDGTRIEPVPIGRGGTHLIRLAAGQETILNLEVLCSTIEQVIDDKSWTENVSGWLNREIYSIINPLYRKENVLHRLYYDPNLNPSNNADSAIFETQQIPIIEFLHSQARGHFILEEIRSSPAIQTMLDVSDEKVIQLESNLENVPDLRDFVTQWYLTRPEFIDVFRTKLRLSGRTISPETAYFLARAATEKKGVKILLKPIAVIIDKILKEKQEYIESIISAPLPFKF